MRTPFQTALWASAVVGGALLVGACGDNTQSQVCGPGTMDDGNGTCVPTGGGTCGPGTIEMNGECVPDPDVVCDDGTVFDPATGTCVPSDEVCGDGTVLIDGVCRDPGTIEGATEESAEINDQTGAGVVAVPAVGAPGFVMHGCVTPHSPTAADTDPWLMHVDAPAVLEISADGVAGLAAGFFMINLDSPQLATWQRFGLNLTSDTSQRQVYLPAAGDYALIIADQRQFFLPDAVVGNDTTCYYATVSQVALPAAVAIDASGTQTGTDAGDVQIFNFTPAADGAIFSATMTSQSASMFPGWVATRGTSLHGVAGDFDGFAAGPARYIGDVDATDGVNVVVDMEYNYGLAAQAFQIAWFDVEAAPLADATVTEQNGDFPADPIVDGPSFHWRDFNFYYFDVSSANEVVHFDMNMSTDVAFGVFRADPINNVTGALDLLIAPPEDFSFSGQFIKFNNPGRYYVGFYDFTGASGTTWDLTATLTPSAPTTFAVPGSVTAAALSSVTGTAFLAADASAADWLEATGGGTNLGAGEGLRIDFYDLSQEGWLDATVLEGGSDFFADPFFGNTFSADGSDAPVGRITHNFPVQEALIRVHSTGAPATGQTFDLATANRTFTDLGTVTEAAPISQTGIAVAANSSVRFLVDSTGVTTMATTNASFDVSIEHLDYDEFVLNAADASVGNGNETLVANPNFGYVAFTITNTTGTDGTVDLGITSITPAPFLEICPALGGTGAVLPTVVDGSGNGTAVDEGFTAMQTLGTAFSLYGTNVTDFIISTNGWVSFDPGTVVNAAFSNGILPAVTVPNGVLAPFWEDIDFVTICRLDQSNRTIIEWVGQRYGTGQAEHFQLSIFNTGSRAEFAYGPNQVDDGFSATAGAENVPGTVGEQVFRNTAGSAAAGGAYVVITD